jgi:hypothetical protein
MNFVMARQTAQAGVRNDAATRCVKQFLMRWLQ